MEPRETQVAWWPELPRLTLATSCLAAERAQTAAVRAAASAALVLLAPAQEQAGKCPPPLDEEIAGPHAELQTWALA